MKYRPAEDPEERLARYQALVTEWAPRINLVSALDLARFRARHIDDSLRLLPLIEAAPAGPCADVGSGAGLPGIPLAIASGRPWRLIEPRRKRAAFLDEVVRELQLDCEVVATTAEEAAGNPRYAGAHVAVTARALARPQVAVALLGPLLAPGGTGIVMLGEGETQAPDQTEWWESGVAIFTTGKLETEG